MFAVRLWPKFQHTAARRRLAGGRLLLQRPFAVSTHSRPKAAGLPAPRTRGTMCSFNTQPPEGGWQNICRRSCRQRRFQHTAARRRLGKPNWKRKGKMLFQHTAARRRLDGHGLAVERDVLFQHTAARRRLESLSKQTLHRTKFQHTAARRRLARGIHNEM